MRSFICAAKNRSCDPSLFKRRFLFDVLPTILFFLLFPLGATATVAEKNACIDAAHSAAHATGVPSDLLIAITTTETRHRGSAWPWTINDSGTPSWHATRAQAEQAARLLLENGRSIDVGCFQINSDWHGAAFPTVESMFDPETNARYAAEYLLHLRSQVGDWSKAIAAYHSRDPDRGADYLRRVSTALAEKDLVGTGRRSDFKSRNSYPLLVGGEKASTGSLVPRLSGNSPLIGGP